MYQRVERCKAGRSPNADFAFFLSGLADRGKHRQSCNFDAGTLTGVGRVLLDQVVFGPSA